MERRLVEGENAVLSTLSSAPSPFSTVESPRNPLTQPSTPRRPTQSTPVPSTPKQSSLHKDRIDELESFTITKLADIMLHPPSYKVVSCEDGEEIIKYLWTNESDVNHNSLDGKEESEAKKRSIPTRCDAENYRTEQSLSGFKCRYENSQEAHEAVTMLGLSIPRRVCQHPFKKNDIVWYVQLS